MTPDALDALTRAREHGVSISPRGERLRLRAPSKPPDELIEALRAHKAEILAWLSRRADTHKANKGRSSAYRAVVHFRLIGSGQWHTRLGTTGATESATVAALHREYGDRLAETRTPAEILASGGAGLLGDRPGYVYPCLNCAGAGRIGRKPCPCCRNHRSS